MELSTEVKEVLQQYAQELGMTTKEYVVHIVTKYAKHLMLMRSRRKPTCYRGHNIAEYGGTTPKGVRYCKQCKLIDRRARYLRSTPNAKRVPQRGKRYPEGHT